MATGATMYGCGCGMKVAIYQQIEASYTEHNHLFASSSLNVNIHRIAINGYTHLATRVALFRPGNKAAARNRGLARKLQCRRGRAALFDVLDTTDEHGRKIWKVTNSGK
jgi:hypothetical protein